VVFHPLGIGGGVGQRFPRAVDHRRTGAGGGGFFIDHLLQRPASVSFDAICKKPRLGQQIALDLLAQRVHPSPLNDDVQSQRSGGDHHAECRQQLDKDTTLHLFTRKTACARTIYSSLARSRLPFCLPRKKMPPGR
jgi:hypothetical protein